MHRAENVPEMGTTKGVFSCTTAARDFSPHTSHLKESTVQGLYSKAQKGFPTEKLQRTSYKVIP